MHQKSDFLSDLHPRKWLPEESSALHPVGLFLGKGTLAMEIVVAHAAHLPSDGEIRRIWSARKGNRGCPVLLVILTPSQACLCGPTGEKPPIYRDIDLGQLERLCRKLLDQPDRHAALSLLSQTLPSFHTQLPGLRNEGLLALHELEHGVPQRTDLKQAAQKATPILGKQGHDLLNALGFSVEPLDNLTSVLRSNDRRQALAVMLHEDESVEDKEPRFNQLSPVTYAFRNADKEDLKWIIFTQGNRIRLYTTDINVGVGRRGRTETYIECQPWLLKDDHLHYLWLLYSAEALSSGGSLYELLEGSTRYAGDLAKSLRERIYEHVVPVLADGIVQARGIQELDTDQLAVTYEMALTVLFRLLFIAYAEDRDLLPYSHNESYRKRSLKDKARELADAVTNEIKIADGSTHWQETVHLFEAVSHGNTEWGVPAYGGALFSSDDAISHVGAELAKVTLSNECFETALRHLLVTQTAERRLGPVDFRSLGVREFGTIYEGLLESCLARAETDLVLKTIRKNAVYVPAKEGQKPAIKAGDVYLHNRSGARKSSGSYYTKSFAVDHLLDGSLKPALKDHFDRLDAMDDTDAGEAFFNFRVADIAMGSGHFLISAIDLMEQQMTNYLANRRLSRVMNELEDLRTVAMERLKEIGGSDLIEDSQLLRRLVARRCIYGVDINPLAVQLARLAVWIHTFVPGLPLSFLDRTLILGNALVGLGTIKEMRDAFEERSVSIFPIDTEKILGKAQKPLRRLANSNDSSLADIQKAREAENDVREALHDARILCDLLTAAPITKDPAITKVLDEWEELSESLNLDDPKISEALETSRNALVPLSAVHFPISFPEVFLRDRSGFDVILGNPPWEKIQVEKDAFWARHFPGLRGKKQSVQVPEIKRLKKEHPNLEKIYTREVAQSYQLRTAIVNGNYPGISSGNPDLYKAFCWRFWRLSNSYVGYLGVVLPRSAVSGKGLSDFRKTMLSEAVSVNVTTLTNRAEWIFDNIHQQYNIVLLCAKHGKPEGNSIQLSGPFKSLSDWKNYTSNSPSTFSFQEINDWNSSASLPLLPTPDSVEVFAQLRKSPRLDLKVDGLWRARPNMELNATTQKPLMDVDNLECPDGYWPIFKGESFDLWTPDTEVYYAWANPDLVLTYLQNKRWNSRNNPRSAHSEFEINFIRSSHTLPCLKQRIAFRDVTGRTNHRTVIACLIPANVFLTNAAPYFLFPHGDEKDQSYLLGVLSSIPLDWYARRFVETHVNFFVINPFPIPRPTRECLLWKRTVQIAGRLACPDDRFAEWAKKVGVDCGPINDTEKEDLIYELDAVVAHLYELSEPQLVHIFETFHENWDYEARLSGVLAHYQKWTQRL